MIRKMLDGLRGSLDFGDLDNAIKGAPGGMRAQHLATAAAEQLLSTQVSFAPEATAQQNGNQPLLWAETPAEQSYGHWPKQ